MHERIETMGHALRTALRSKEQWRHRALEAEQQLGALRGQVGWPGGQGSALGFCAS